MGGETEDTARFEAGRKTPNGYWDTLLAVGIDLDEPSATLARATTTVANVAFVRTDILHAPFAPKSFDAIFSVATMHHLPLDDALHALITLLRPGGVLGIIGLARSTPVDLPTDALGGVAHRYFAHTGGRQCWEHSAPTVWPPPDTYRAVRRRTAQLLPGRTFRRHLLWRYSIVWTKPPDG